MPGSGGRVPADPRAGTSKAYGSARNAEANAPDELLRFYTTPDTGQCGQCAITNVADPAVVSTDYVPRSRELWALSPEALQGSTLRLVPHRIVGHLTYPGGQVAYLFVATGPQSRPG